MQGTNAKQTSMTTKRCVVPQYGEAGVFRGRSADSTQCGVSFPEAAMRLCQGLKGLGWPPFMALGALGSKQAVAF